MHQVKPVLGRQGAEVGWQALRDAAGIPRGAALAFGMVLEGASWDAGGDCMAEPLVRRLRSPLPPVLLTLQLLGPTAGVVAAPAQLQPLASYSCPLYAQGSRGEALVAVGLPTGGQAPEHWVKRGAAILSG